MKGYIRAAIVSRKTTIFFIVLSMIFGIYNYIYMPKQETPDFAAPYAKITVVYPGASPEEVEKQVTDPIEDVTAEVPGYKSVQSYSKNSISIVVLELDSGADIEAAWTVLKDKMSTLESELPDGVTSVDVNTDITETAGIIISLSGENYTYNQLADIASDIEKELTKVDGISRFDVVGKQEETVVVKVNTSKLNQYGLTLDEISQIIAAQNYELPLGNLSDDDTKINVTAAGSLAAVSDIENLIISVSADNGSSLRLKDIADVTKEYADSNYKIKQNGENAVLLTGYFKEDENIVLIGKDVETVIQSFEKTLPEDLKFEEVLFQPGNVSRSINNFLLNLVEALILVIITVFLGMGFRNALITSISIPLSITLSFSVMALLGIKIHQISISALIIALGMLVDNAVVVTDAIQVHLDRGASKLDACVNGVREVNIPILTSTLTTVGAFLPLLLLTGTAGDYIESIPQVVIIALSASYLVAIFAIPTFSYLFLEPSKNVKKPSRIKPFFTNLLERAFDHKKATFAIVLVLIVMAGYLGGNLGLKFFPMADTDMVYMNITAESSTSIDETEKIVDQIEAIIGEQPEVVSYTAAIGDGLPKFYTTLPLSTQSNDYAQIMMKLDLSKTDRFKSNDYFVDYLQNQIDGAIAEATVSVRELEQGDPSGSPINVKLTADSMEELSAVVSELKAVLVNVEGTVGVSDNLSEEVFEFEVTYDNVAGSYRGVSLYDMEKEIGIALRGKTASILKNDGDESPIIVKSDITTKEMLENLEIKSTATGQKVLLKDIADVTLVNKSPVIKKVDRELSATVSSDVKPGYNSVEIQNTFDKRIQDLDMQGVNLEYKGEKEKIIDSFGDMGILSIFSIIIIYGILLIQFNSFKQPIIIFAAIPLSVIGSVVGLTLFRQSLSFTAMLGIVSLFGMVVNNAIILIDYINGERKEGKDTRTACVDAVGRRFRPIILTTTTTVIGLIPLVLTGGELFRPMAISLMFGLLISMFLTLVLVPIIYSIFMKSN